MKFNYSFGREAAYTIRKFTYKTTKKNLKYANSKSTLYVDNCISAGISCRKIKFQFENRCSYTHCHSMGTRRHGQRGGGVLAPPLEMLKSVFVAENVV